MVDAGAASSSRGTTQPPGPSRWVIALERLNRAPWARCLRDGMVWLVPYLMLWSVVLLLGAVLSQLQPVEPAARLLLQMSAELRHMMPLVVWGSVGAMAALHFNLMRTPVAFICLSMGAASQQILASLIGERGEAWTMFLALIGPYPAVAAMASVARSRWAQIATDSSASSRNVAESINLILPGLVVTGLMCVLLVSTTVVTLAMKSAMPLEAILRLPDEWIGLIYVLCNSIAWFFGVHGYYLLLPLLEVLPQATLQPQHPISQTFLGLFVFIGGCGATLSLVIALLLSAGRSQLRTIALVSVAPALINVNETLLFGLPIILNPRLLLPFVLVPTVNYLIACTAAWAGWVSITSLTVPFNSPVLLNALLSTGGDGRAALLQLVNVTVGTLIYLPFVRPRKKSPSGLRRGAALHAQETEYVRRMEDANFRLGKSANGKPDAPQAQPENALKDHDFVLFFQPKVDPSTHLVRGSEALIRLMDDRGHLLTPGNFLPELEREGLLSAVDLWVARTAVEQQRQWRAAGHPVLPMSINVTAATLLNPATVNQLVQTVESARGAIEIEITEGSLLQDEPIVAEALEALRSAGARLFIDDFGTGFSSLSYLYRFRFDGIKIDRSFTNALTFERGRKLFDQLCSMARQMELELVVEGVEEEWQLGHIPRDLPVSVQGFLYSKPLPPESFMQFVLNAQNGQTASAVAELADA